MGKRVTSRRFTERQERAMALTRSAAQFLAALPPYDPRHRKVFRSFVSGECAVTSELVARLLREHGYDAEAMYGTVGVRRGEGNAGRDRDRLEHVWVKAEGLHLDPVLWVQGFRRSLLADAPRIKDSVAETMPLLASEEQERYMRKLRRAVR